MGRVTIWTVAAVVSTASTASAQLPRERSAPSVQQREAQLARQLRESRYQIGQIERVLEGAVEHGATVIRDRLQAAMPADMLLTENARARGFRLDGYGVFFDVQVPSLEGTLPWSFRTLDQNNLGLDNALTTVRAFVQARAANDVDLQQALKRIELQVASVGGTTGGVAIPTSSAGFADPAAPAVAADAILANPNEAYRSSIRSALIDAMLEHSRGLGIGPTEWLTVAARGSDDRPRLAPADSENRTVMISVRGSDLAAFLAGQISHEEAVARIEVRVF
jgi:hypothetical protein